MTAPECKNCIFARQQLTVHAKIQFLHSFGKFFDLLKIRQPGESRMPETG